MTGGEFACGCDRGCIACVFSFFSPFLRVSARSKIKRQLVHITLHEIVLNLQKIDHLVNNILGTNLHPFAALLPHRLAPHLTSKNMLLMTNLFSLFADEVYLDSVLADESLAKDVEKVQHQSFH